MLSSLLFASLFSATISGAPLADETSVCYPNAMGSPVSIVSESTPLLKWGMTETPAFAGSKVDTIFTGLGPNFRIEQDGQWPPAYIIKDNDDNTLAATFREDHLELAKASDSGTDELQLFDIICNSCNANPSNEPGMPSGTGCLIRHHDMSEQCITFGVVHAHSRPTLLIAPCDATNDQRQLFDIMT